MNYDAVKGLIVLQTHNSNVFIGLYCCLLIRVQPLSLAWVGLHNTENLWALFQGYIVEFWLDYPIFYLRTSKYTTSIESYLSFWGFGHSYVLVGKFYDLVKETFGIFLISFEINPSWDHF